ncbi:hypothetical protein AB0I72_26670 [Nocardiopsis sp. NPDC049922]|uniref:hypothetical protein n=1 Tax=Nocardiopsis sp. NPDC049922 TaxID=3155157 RepID=UPI0033D55E48
MRKSHEVERRGNFLDGKDIHDVLNMHESHRVLAARVIDANEIEKGDIAKRTPEPNGSTPWWRVTDVQKKRDGRVVIKGEIYALAWRDLEAWEENETLELLTGGETPFLSIRDEQSERYRNGA